LLGPHAKAWNEKKKNLMAVKKKARKAFRLRPRDIGDRWESKR